MGNKYLYETLVVKRDEGVGIVTLNNPKRLQAINLAMSKELKDCMDKMEGDNDVRAILLNSTGQAFCSGYDLSPDGQKEAEDVPLPSIYNVKRVNEGMFALMEVQKPVIGAIQGFAVGGGVALAMACDLLIASDAAKFRFVYVHRGCVVDGGPTWLLPRIVGLRKAFELMYFPDFIDAAEAKEIGLINKVVPADRFEEESMKYAKRIASGATLAMGISKNLVYRGLNMDMRTAIEFEPWGQQMARFSKDREEGIKAFFEKRQPKFVGR